MADRWSEREGGAVGQLADGTPYFAPLGELPYDRVDDTVQCHLCGRWFRFVGGTHLIRTHGWTVEQHREAFHLFYIVKPFTPRELVGRLRGAIRRRAQPHS